MEIGLVNEFLAMYFQSGVGYMYINDDTNPNLDPNRLSRSSTPNFTSIQLGWETSGRFIQKEMLGLGNVSEKCPRECPEREFRDTVPGCLNRNLITLCQPPRIPTDTHEWV